jgi:hypothetical protein
MAPSRDIRRALCNYAQLTSRPAVAQLFLMFSMHYRPVPLHNIFLPALTKMAYVVNVPPE